MIKRPWYRGLAALLLMALCSFVQAEEPAKARARLGVIVGSWTIEGMEKAFSETCAWYDGNSHVVCTSEEKEGDRVSRGVSVLSYSEHAGTYAYYHYGSSGFARYLTGFHVDGNWLFTGERRTSSGDTVRSQVRMSPMGEAFGFKEERSTNGGPWQTVAEFKYVRRKP
jgi:hypothetical protein